MSARRAGFTLLEVIIALGIMAVALVVLVDTQSLAVFMTADAERTARATMLAEEKTMEVMLKLEREGWTSQDVEETGTFEGFGEEEFRGESLHLDLEADLEDFQWAYTVRRIELTLPSDLGGMADTLQGNGYFPEAEEGAPEGPDVASSIPDLSTFGVTPEVMGEYLSDYIREVRVVVWWGENEDETDQVEIVHHVINPTGVVANPQQDGR